MTAVTPSVIAWLLKQSQAQRGRSEVIEQTCATFADWVNLVSGNGGAGQFKQLMRVPYPQPTPVTVCMSLALPSMVQTSQRGKLYGAAPFGVPPAPLQDQVGTILVEWIVAGAQFAVMCDLGAGALSLPAVDQVTVSYATPIPTGASPGQIAVSIVPALSPGAVATLTKLPAVIPAGAFAPNTAPRQAFARRWKLTACQSPAPGVPVPIGPIVVMVGIGADPAEQVSFADFTGSAGVSAVNQGWVECGAADNYSAFNLGAVDVLATIIEQLQVG